MLSSAVLGTITIVEFVLPISEARGLRDEIASMLADLNSLNKTDKENKTNEIIEVQIKGGTFK